MRRYLFIGAGAITAAAMMFASPALAGGNLWAPSSPTFSTVNSSGWYVGLGSSAALASGNVSGNVIALPGVTGGSINAAGGTLNVDIGYIWGRCLLNTWCQVELAGKYENIDASNAVGTISGRWAFTQEFDMGIDVLQTLTALLPGISNPFPTFNPSSLLPSNIAVATTPRGYFGFKQEELLVGGNVGSAGGQTWAYAPGVTSGFRWQTLNTAGKPNGGSIKVYADILWPMKGVSLSNVFGAGGAPVVTGANASLNTLYVAGFQYDFGVGH